MKANMTIESGEQYELPVGCDKRFITVSTPTSLGRRDDSGRNWRGQRQIYPSYGLHQQDLPSPDRNGGRKRLRAY